MPTKEELKGLKVFQLKTIAKKMGVPFTKKSKAIELRSAILAASKAEEKPQATVPVTEGVKTVPVVEQPAQTVAPVVQEQPAPVVNKNSSDDRVMVELHESEAIPPNGLFINCNGDAIQVVPGKKVAMKRKHLQVLQDAVETKYKQAGGVENPIVAHEVPRFPFSVSEI